MTGFNLNASDSDTDDEVDQPADPPTAPADAAVAVSNATDASAAVSTTSSNRPQRRARVSFGQQRKKKNAALIADKGGVQFQRVSRTLAGVAFVQFGRKHKYTPALYYRRDGPDSETHVDIRWSIRKDRIAQASDYATRSPRFSRHRLQSIPTCADHPYLGAQLVMGCPDTECLAEVTGVWKWPKGGVDERCCGGGIIVDPTLPDAFDPDRYIFGLKDEKGRAHMVASDQIELRHQKMDALSTASACGETVGDVAADACVGPAAQRDAYLPNYDTDDVEDEMEECDAEESESDDDETLSLRFDRLNPTRVQQRLLYAHNSAKGGAVELTYHGNF